MTQREQQYRIVTGRDVEPDDIAAVRIRDTEQDSFGLVLKNVDGILTLLTFEVVKDHEGVWLRRKNLEVEVGDTLVRIVSSSRGLDSFFLVLTESDSDADARKAAADLRYATQSAMAAE